MHDVQRRLARIDGSMRRKKSRRAFHLERTRYIRFDQTYRVRRHSTNKHAFRPHAAGRRDERKIPFPRFTLLSYRREKIQ